MNKSLLKAHLVFVTKYRKTILEPISDTLKASIDAFCNDKGINLLACETDKDHIHLLIEHRPQMALSFIVQLLKQKTAYEAWLKHEHYLRCQYWSGRHILWSNGYFSCSTGELSPDTIRKYIDNQI